MEDHSKGLHHVIMKRETLTLEAQMRILCVKIWDSEEKKRNVDFWLGWKLDATVGISLGWVNIPCHPSEDPETLLLPARRINLDKLINCPGSVTETQNVSQMRLLSTYTISIVIIILHAFNSWWYSCVCSGKRPWNPSRYSSIPTTMSDKWLLFLQNVSTEL